MKLVIGSDECGFALKQVIKTELQRLSHEVIDLIGENYKDNTPYYETAVKAGKMVSAGEAEQAILCCGTGMGMAIVANKVTGIYAAVCENAYAARMARAINNANVLALGGWVTTPEMAKEILAAWFATDFVIGFEDEREWLEASMVAIERIEQGA